MIHPVDVADVHAHAESLGSHNQLFLALLEGAHNFFLLLFVFLAVVRSHPMAVRRADPAFQPQVDAPGKRIVQQGFMPVQEAFYAG